MTTAPVRVDAPATALDARPSPTVSPPRPTGQFPDDPGPPKARWSLERRLPLLILALLAAVILGFGFATYREVRDAAIERTEDRLEGLARELIGNVARSNAQRQQALQALAGDSVVGAVLVGTSDPEVLARVERRLETSVRQGDSLLLGLELWTLDGQRRFGSARGGLNARDSVALRALLASTVADSLQRSPLVAVDSGVHYWTLVPVYRDAAHTGTPIGALAELRKLGSSARAEQTLRQLTGEDVQVIYANGSSDQWATLGGRPTASRFALPDSEGVATRVADRNGVSQFAVHASLPGSPFGIVLLQSEASVHRRSREFVGNLVGIGLTLLALGTLGAWALSRRVTRPLADLGDAAEAMARGDYTYRVTATGGAEMAQLAHTFNSMATRIGDAHAVLEHQNAALQRANEAKTRFLAMMSHELRTPLNAIGGYADLLALGIRGPTTPAQVEDLSRIRRNKDQLLNIIADILHFSRVDAGHLALRLEPLRVSDVFTALADTVGPQFAAKPVTLEIVPSDTGVYADTGRLQQVLVNLLTNALRFTSPGGSVTVSATLHDEWTHIAVRDTGVGIPAEKLDAIFEPFVQVDASLTRRVGGTGLGLSIARELVEAMGGTISVESTLGVGSTFLVVLPSATGA